MANENEDESKRSAKRTIGQFNFVLLTMITMAAIACGLASMSHCDFLRRKVTITPGLTAGNACNNYDLASQCEILVRDQGVGLYSWSGVIPNFQNVCFSYTQWIEGVGYVTPDVGTKVKAVRGFAIVADFFGLLAVFTLLISICCPFVPGRIIGLPIYFFMAMLFQGLTLLMFRSSVCDRGFFGPYFRGYPDVDAVVQGVDCGLGKGATLSIVSTVLYFLAMILSPTAIPPTPLGMKDEDMYPQRNRTNEPAKEGPAATESEGGQRKTSDTGNELEEP